MPFEGFGPFSFTYPAAWTRRTSIVCVGTGREDAPPNLTITREKRAGDETVYALARRHVRSLARRPHFELLTDGPATIGGCPAYRTLARWSLDHDQVTEARAWIAGPDGETLTVTCTAVDAPSAFDELERLLESIRFEPDARAVAAPPPAPAPVARVAVDAYSIPVPMPGDPTRRR